MVTASGTALPNSFRSQQISQIEYFQCFGCSHNRRERMQRPLPTTILRENNCDGDDLMKILNEL